MKRRIISIVLAFVAVLTLASCKKTGYDKKYEYDGHSLVGKWQNVNPDHSAYSVYEFGGGGESYNTATVTVYIYGIEAVKQEATYRVEDKNVLVLDFSDGLQNIGSQKYKFSISDGKIYINDKNNTTLEPYNLSYNQDDKIFGSWRDAEDSDNLWSFLSDYSGLVSDENSANNICYSTEGDTLNVFVNENFSSVNGEYTFSAENVLRYKYKIEGNILTLSIDGNEYVLERQ